MLVAGTQRLSNSEFAMVTPVSTLFHQELPNNHRSCKPQTFISLLVWSFRSIQTAVFSKCMFYFPKVILFLSAFWASWSENNELYYLTTLHNNIYINITEHGSRDGGGKIVMHEVCLCHGTVHFVRKDEPWYRVMTSTEPRYFISIYSYMSANLPTYQPS